MVLPGGKELAGIVLQFIEDYGQDIHRIMLNSDGAKSLSLPFLQLLEPVECLDTESRWALVRENAVRFFNLVPWIQGIPRTT